MHSVEGYEGLAGLRWPHGGEVSDVVEAVLYLERSPFVTGGVIPRPTVSRRRALIPRLAQRTTIGSSDAGLAPRSPEVRPQRLKTLRMVVLDRRTVDLALKERDQRLGVRLVRRHPPLPRRVP